MENQIRHQCPDGSWIWINTKTMKPITEEVVVAPSVTTDVYGTVNKLTVHSHIDARGKMVLNKKEAALLLIELLKFIK